MGMLKICQRNPCMPTHITFEFHLLRYRSERTKQGIIRKRKRTKYERFKQQLLGRDSRDTKAQENGERPSIVLNCNMRPGSSIATGVGLLLRKSMSMILNVGVCLPGPFMWPSPRNNSRKDHEYTSLQRGACTFPLDGSAEVPYFALNWPTPSCP